MSPVVGRGRDTSGGDWSSEEPDGDEQEPVVVPIEDAIDLHLFAPRDVPAVVADYLDAAAARGLLEVRLIHGRGKGVQRAVVQRLLAAHSLVESYWDAPPDRGGWGATVVRLRPSAHEPPRTSRAT